MRSRVGLGLALALVCTAAYAGDPPPQYGPPRPIEPVALFKCTDGKCQITCSTASGDKVIPVNDWAIVYKYPNSNPLWLYAAGGPNNQFLLGEAFCDFSKIYKIWPAM